MCLSLRLVFRDRDEATGVVTIELEARQIVKLLRRKSGLGVK